MNNLTIADVVEAVKRDFPENQRKRVLEILDEYGRNASEPEKVRVCFAILELSCKDIEKIKKYTTEAKIDSTNVIFWAE